MTLRTRESVTPSAVWPSPITAQQAAAGRMRLQDVQLSDGDAYWIEGRPVEHGRCVIVREHDGVITDLHRRAVFGAHLGARVRRRRRCALTRGTVYFSNAADGRVHCLVPNSRAAPEPLTPATPGSATRTSRSTPRATASSASSRTIAARRS